MDIAALSTALSTANANMQVGIFAMKKSMQSEETSSELLLSSIQAPPTNGLGKYVDISV